MTPSPMSPRRRMTLSSRDQLQKRGARPRKSLRQRVSGDAAAVFVGLAAGVCLVVVLVVVLARHVDYDWDSEFVALHDRWDAEGVKPGGAVPAGQMPPPATDW